MWQHGGGGWQTIKRQTISSCFRQGSTFKRSLDWDEQLNGKASFLWSKRGTVFIPVSFRIEDSHKHKGNVMLQMWIHCTSGGEGRRGVLLNSPYTQFVQCQLNIQLLAFGGSSRWKWWFQLLKKVSYIYTFFFYPFQFSKKWRLLDLSGERAREGAGEGVKSDCRILCQSLSRGHWALLWVKTCCVSVNNFLSTQWDNSIVAMDCIW